MNRHNRGVALLVVLMIILGLIVLGQSAMLWMDRVAQSSGLYRRQEGGAYCADEGVALGRAWVLAEMGAAAQIDPQILNHFLADPADPADLSSAVKDLCQAPPVTLPSGLLVTSLAGLCRTDPAGNPMYSINLIDDIDEAPPNMNPFKDGNNVFMIRSECKVPALSYKANSGLSNNKLEQIADVAVVEVNQAGSTPCYGVGGLAGCGGG
jgi:hypothetical protein